MSSIDPNTPKVDLTSFESTAKSSKKPVSPSKMATVKTVATIAAKAFLALSVAAAAGAVVGAAVFFGAPVVLAGAALSAAIVLKGALVTGTVAAVATLGALVLKVRGNVESSPEVKAKLDSVSALLGLEVAKLSPDEVEKYPDYLELEREELTNLSKSGIDSQSMTRAKSLISKLDDKIKAIKEAKAQTKAQARQNLEDSINKATHICISYSHIVQKGLIPKDNEIEMLRNLQKDILKFKLSKHIDNEIDSELLGRATKKHFDLQEVIDCANSAQKNKPVNITSTSTAAPQAQQNASNVIASGSYENGYAG